MNARRYLCILLPLLTAWVCFGEPLKPLPPYKVRPYFTNAEPIYPQGNCPPEDVGGWAMDSRIVPASKVYWATVPMEEIDRYCGQVWACAESRDGVGFIYAIMPADFYPNFLKLHEFCHTQGWVHWQANYGESSWHWLPH